MATNAVATVMAELFPLGANTPSQIRASDLSVDPRYQREINPNQVAKIIREFDPDLLGGLLVSQRINGDMAVLDGQTRLKAIMDMGYGDQLLPCFVRRNLSPEREAYIFEKTNVNRRGMSPYSVWRSQLFRKDPDAVAIQKIMSGLGLRFVHGKTHNPNVVRAIVAVKDIYDQLGAIGLHRTLRVLRLAWKDLPDAFDRNLIVGVSLMLTAYPSVSDDRLIRRLAKTEPSTVLRKAGVMKGRHGDAVAAYVGFEIVDIWNKTARGADRLPVKGTGELALAMRGLRGGVSIYKNPGKEAGRVRPDRQRKVVATTPPTS